MGIFNQLAVELDLNSANLEDKDVQAFIIAYANRKQSKEWIQYRNGNVICEINKDTGTCIRTALMDEPIQYAFPTNIDVHTSAYCTAGCEFCYAECTTAGMHSDIKKFIEDKNSFLYSLHAGTELALNGNEPLHPDLELLLAFCKERDIIANLTVNEITLIKHKDQIEAWLDNKLIHGIGISPKYYSVELIDFCKLHSTAVIHTIAGITTIAQYNNLKDQGLKILILGYKNFGRGDAYLAKYTAEITENIALLKTAVKDYVNHFNVVSFDNLALQQLSPKDWVPKDRWEEIYMGEDGTSTFFINLVDETFALNSMQPKCKHKMLLANVSDMLKIIQKETK